MLAPEKVRSVIFDFDGTLCSGRYFEPLGQPTLDRIASLLFGAASSDWAEPWMRGEHSSADIAAHLSEHLAMSSTRILDALNQGSARMTFNPAVLAFAKAQRRAGRKTALVTLNMDVFTEVVVPAHGLHDLFDTIINSADHGTLDKRALWRKAFDALGPEFDYPTSLALDDKAAWVEAFRAQGGHAHRYSNDDAFRRWLRETGFAELDRPAIDVAGTRTWR